MKRPRTSSADLFGSDGSCETSIAGLRIVVTENYAMTWLLEGDWVCEDGEWRWKSFEREWKKPPVDTGPLRLRVTGDVEALGCWDSYWDWDPENGIDLFWEGRQWTSLVLPVPPETTIRFRVFRLEQSESHPGVLQGNHRIKVHESRQCGWGWEYSLESPDAGQVVEATLSTKSGDNERMHAFSALSCSVTSWTQAVVRPEVPDPFRLSGSAGTRRHPGGTQRLYLFDAPNDMLIKSCLYLPPGYHEQPCVDDGQDCSRSEGWPLLIFFHSMHGRLDGDNNLFYESDTPLELLLGDERCPEALRERFVVIAPECPADKDRGDGGVWLRHGWYEESAYASEVEKALASLFETTVTGLRIDPRRICITGSSMGAYASLELALRWPGTFAALAPVAGHYDLDPVDELVSTLAQQAVPVWFFHAFNDDMCPYPPMASLVDKLRARSGAEVRFTSFEDTWSNHGHCADRVAYWTSSRPDDEPAPYETHGEELFRWLAAQRGPGRHLFSSAANAVAALATGGGDGDADCPVSGGGRPPRKRPSAAASGRLAKAQS